MGQDLVNFKEETPIYHFDRIFKFCFYKMQLPISVDKNMYHLLIKFLKRNIVPIIDNYYGNGDILSRDNIS